MCGGQIYDHVCKVLPKQSKLKLCICALQCKNKHKAEALQGTYYVGRLVKPVLDTDPAENRLSSFRPSSPLDALSDINLS